MDVRKMARCALFSALLSVCAWVSIPLGDSFVTLQTLGIFLCLGLLGGKWGTASILIYLLLGAVGLPVFSGFRGGMGVLLDTTGGYLTGFLLAGLLYWALTHHFPNNKKAETAALVLGLLLCYAFGTLWYWKLYLQGGGSGAFTVVLIKCVVPYLLPDAIKLTVARLLTGKLKRFV